MLSETLSAACFRSRDTRLDASLALPPYKSSCVSCYEDRNIWKKKLCQRLGWNSWLPFKKMLCWLFSSYKYEQQEKSVRVWWDVVSQQIKFFSALISDFNSETICWGDHLFCFIYHSVFSLQTIFHKIQGKSSNRFGCWIHQLKLSTGSFAVLQVSFRRLGT